MKRLVLVLLPLSLAVSGCAVGVYKPTTYISDRGATLNADVQSNVGDTEYWWRYGASVEMGSETPHHTVTIRDTQPNLPHAVSQPIAGLVPNSTYTIQLCVSDQGESPPRTVCNKTTTFRTPPAGGRSGIAFTRGLSIDVLNPDFTVTTIPNTDRGDYPTWSPDGTKIAYTADSDIYTAQAGDGGGKTNLTHNGLGDLDPAWSPDGTKIAFISGRDGGLPQVWLMNADGSNPTRLTTAGHGVIQDLQLLTWSPDGAKLAYTADDGGLEQIWVMNADGSNQHNITNSSGTYNSQPAWSPDGTQIAFLKNDTVWVMNSDGSDQSARSTSTNFDDNHPTWSPDGSKIAFQARRHGNAIEIWRMDADGNNQISLSNAPPNTPWEDRYPAWSPRP